MKAAIVTFDGVDDLDAFAPFEVLGDLGDRGVQITDARVADDGDVLSVGGVTSGLDMALWLIERY